MYSLILVEDEPIVLEGMIKIIDFESLGFQVVSACGNGLEALEAYKKYKPDVVITDICMEIMDGLEFIEEVNREKNDTKFVIISGHQDFKFFKRALSLKVTDYILKPVTARELRELLLRIADELNGVKEEVLPVNHFKEYVEVEKNAFFNRFMHVKMNRIEVASKLNSFGIELDAPLFQAAIYKMNQLDQPAVAKGQKSADELLNSLYQDIRELMADEPGTLVFLEPQGNVILIANKSEQQALQKVFVRVTEVVREKYLGENAGVVDCYVGLEVSNIYALPNSYKSANRLNICGILDNGIGLYQSEEILFSRANKRLDYSMQMESWVKEMIFGDQHSRITLEGLFIDFKNASFLLTDLRVAATRMQDYLEKALALLNRPLEQRSIVTMDQMSEKAIKTALQAMTDRVVDSIGKNSRGKDSYIALKAVTYIEKHYTDTNIDLSQVCEVLNVSVSYFSVVFKKHTSMTFVKYLNSFRIEKAKYFLDYSDATIGEISEMVGFVEPHYFGIVFKKYTQTTPKKYRMSQR